MLQYMKALLFSEERRGSSLGCLRRFKTGPSPTAMKSQRPAVGGRVPINSTVGVAEIVGAAVVHPGVRGPVYDVTPCTRR